MAYVQPPPAIYDHAFRGAIHTYQHRLGEVDAYCNGVPVYGCAPVGGIAGECDIHIVAPDRNGISREFYARVLRHERAHCNGWAANHPT